MIDITLVAIGKIKDKAYSSLVTEYFKRIKPFARLKIVELEATSFSEKLRDKAKEFEGEKIENYLNKQKEPVVYLLAERGKSLSSVELANWLEKKSPPSSYFRRSARIQRWFIQKIPELISFAFDFSS